MKRILCAFLALSMIFAMTCSLSGCNEGGNSSDKTKITFSEELPYSSEATAYSKNVILSLLKYGYKKAVMPNISQLTEEKLEKIAVDISAISASTPISESVYRSFWETVSLNGPAVIDELLLLRSKEDNSPLSLEKTKELYLSLASLVSYGYIGDILYESCKYYYDYAYGVKKADYEKYGYKYLLEAANKLDSDRRIFASIGSESFSGVMRWSLVMGELLSKDALRSESLKSFTDAEIVAFIEALDLQPIDISDDAWNLILNTLIPEEKAALPYNVRLLSVAKSCNDTENISKIMGSVSAIYAFALNNLDSNGILMLREGQRDELISEIFKKFTDEEWAHLESIGALELSYDAYKSAAEAEFGEGYGDYLEQIEEVSSEELKALVGTDGFDEALMNYLNGICPMLFYGERV